MSTGACFPNTIHSFSPFLFPVNPKHCGLCENATNSSQAQGRSAVPRLWNRLPGSSKCRRHSVFWAAAEIIPVFNSLVTHRPPHAPHRLSFPAVPLHPSTHIPLLTLPAPPPLRPHGFQDNELVVLNIKIEIQTDGTRTGGQNQVLKEWERIAKRMKITPPTPLPPSLSSQGQGMITATLH